MYFRDGICLFRRWTRLWSGREGRSEKGERESVTYMYVYVVVRCVTEVVVVNQGSQGFLRRFCNATGVPSREFITQTDIVGFCRRLLKM